MSGSWEVNGIALDVLGSVQGKGKSSSRSRKIRQSLEDIHGGGQVRERNGIDLPTKKYTFIFVGGGRAKWDQVAVLQGILENVDEFTIKAPDGYFVTPTYQTVVFSCADFTIEEPDGESVGKLVVTADLIELGVPAGDGGFYTTTESWTEEFA